MRTIDVTTLAEMTICMLERTAMVIAEPSDPGDGHAPPTRFARIEYRGPSQGSLLLSATDGFLRELAASLLGVDTSEVDVEIHGHDALKEMANIVGGSMVLALSGDVCEYSLGLPELLKPERVAQFTAADPSVECTVVAEGGPLRVLWHDATSCRVAA